jgi:hypothetical protein
MDSVSPHPTKLKKKNCDFVSDMYFMAGVDSYIYSEANLGYFEDKEPLEGNFAVIEMLNSSQLAVIEHTLRVYIY